MDEYSPARGKFDTLKKNLEFISSIIKRDKKKTIPNGVGPIIGCTPREKTNWAKIVNRPCISRRWLRFSDVQRDNKVTGQSDIVNRAKRNKCSLPCRLVEGTKS